MRLTFPPVRVQFSRAPGLVRSPYAFLFFFGCF